MTETILGFRKKDALDAVLMIRSYAFSDKAVEHLVRVCAPAVFREQYNKATNKIGDLLVILLKRQAEIKDLKRQLAEKENALKEAIFLQEKYHNEMDCFACESAEKDKQIAGLKAALRETITPNAYRKAMNADLKGAKEDGALGLITKAELNSWVKVFFCDKHMPKKEARK